MHGTACAASGLLPTGRGTAAQPTSSHAVVAFAGAGDGYCKVSDGECWLHNVHIAQHELAGTFNRAPGSLPGCCLGAYRASWPDTRASPWSPQVDREILSARRDTCAPLFARRRPPRLASIEASWRPDPGRLAAVTAAQVRDPEAGCRVRQKRPHDRPAQCLLQRGKPAQGGDRPRPRQKLAGQAGGHQAEAAEH